MARDPDEVRAQSDFLDLDIHDRRAVIRSVNRGLPVAEPRWARFGVVLARRQQRFWRVAWVLGPSIALIQLVIVDWQAAAINGAVGTAALGLVSWIWYRRAARSERANAAMVAQQGARWRSLATAAPSPGSPGTPAAPRRRGWRRRRTSIEATPATSDQDVDLDDEPRTGHLPGEDGTRQPRPRWREEEDGPPLPGQRPYRPRGGKRRGR